MQVQMIFVVRRWRTSQIFSPYFFKSTDQFCYLLHSFVKINKIDQIPPGLKVHVIEATFQPHSSFYPDFKSDNFLSNVTNILNNQEWKQTVNPNKGYFHVHFSNWPQNSQAVGYGPDPLYILAVGNLCQHKYSLLLNVNRKCHCLFFSLPRLNLKY